MKNQIHFISLLLSLFFGIALLTAQAQNIDSLTLLLHKKDITKEKRIELLLKLSSLHLSNRSDTSFLYSTEAVNISRTIGNKELLGFSYRSLGNYYSAKDNYDSCKYFLNLALKNIPNDASTYFYLGDNEFFRGTEDRCLSYFNQAKIISIKKKEYKTLAIVYSSLSEYYRLKQNYSLAQRYINLSIQLLKNTTFYSDLAWSYNLQAEIYRMKGDYKQALEIYIKTAQIAYKILDSTRIGYCYSRMGYIYYMQNDTVKAESYILKSFDLAKKIKSKNLKLFSLKLLTDIYSNKGDVTKCTSYAKQCLALAIESNDLITQAFVYSSQSNLFHKVQQYDSATYYANKSYNLSKTNKDVVNLINSIINKIQVEFKLNNYLSVITLTDEGIILAKEAEMMEDLADLHKYQYMAHEKLNNKKAFFEAFYNYKQISDSLYKSDITLELQKSQLEIKYQEKHLADTLVYIKKAYAVNQEMIIRKQQSTFTFVIGLIVTVLLLIIIFIIWNSSMKRKKLNLSLVESNIEKELLLKEIHHRVKNSLQVVSSLLNLQKTKVQYKNFNELMDESQIKIENIAIVHELLYQTNSFKKINLQQYIDKLSNHILQTLNTENRQISIVKNIENIEISLNNSVPLALVFNEIVTNSVKYAFNTTNKGVIDISCFKINEVIHVKIKDNGLGLSESQFKNNKGIGIKLIEGFIKQLKGELKYGNDNGCFFVFSFHDSN